MSSGDIKKAKEYYDIAKKMQVSKNATQWEYFLIYNSARIKQAERKYDEAVKDHLRAAAYAEKMSWTTSMYCIRSLR